MSANVMCVVRDMRYRQCIIALAICGFCGTGLCFAEDRVVFVTYYPSPYGVYRELRAKRIAVGDNYYLASDSCWPGGCSNTIHSDADLVVEGNIGVGTRTPKASLDINGALRIGAAGTCNGDTANSLRYTTNRFEYCDGAATFRPVVSKVTSTRSGFIMQGFNDTVASNWSVVLFHGHVTTGSYATPVGGYLVKTGATTWSGNIVVNSTVWNPSGSCGDPITVMDFNVTTDSACTLTIANPATGPEGLIFTAFY